MASTITFSLAAEPIWYFVDEVGKPLGGGYLVTQSSLNPTVRKTVFMDAGGTDPFPYVFIPNNPSLTGIKIDENGTLPPIYFQFDTAAPTDLYDLEVLDSNGVPIWQISDFSPGAGGGGGGTVTEVNNLTNLVTNFQFWRNIGSTGSLSTVTNMIIAPGAHSNFSSSPNPALATNPGNQGDIRFIKAGLGSNDQITFTAFTPYGTNALPIADSITPPYYLEYTCVAVPGETAKYIQIPISSDLLSLSGMETTVTLWARVNSGATTLTLNYYQYFGEPAQGASAPVTQLIRALTLTGAWQSFEFQIIVPSVLGKFESDCHDTGLYLQIAYPLSVNTVIDFVLPSVYLGAFAPDFDYLTNDQIDAVINAPRTGDVRTSLNNFQPFGWVAANDGTIGNPTSGASTRANFDTFPLYDLIWNSVSSVSLPLAPIYDSTGNVVALGASSMADFAANNQLALTKVLGQVLAGTVPISTLPIAQVYTANFTTGILTVTNVLTLGAPTGTPVVLTNSGGAVPAGLALNTIYYTIYQTNTTIKLATTLDNAKNNVPLSFTGNGSGTNSIQVYNDVLGFFRGEMSHVLSINEMPSHSHPGSTFPYVAINSAAGGTPSFSPGAGSNYGVNVAAQGGGLSFNTMQPTTFMNVFLKL